MSSQRAPREKMAETMAAAAGWSFEMELSVEASGETELRKLPRAELQELYFSRCLKGKLHFSSTGVV